MFLQEMDVLNALLAEMARSLKELQLGACVFHNIVERIMG